MKEGRENERNKGKLFILYAIDSFCSDFIYLNFGEFSPCVCFSDLKRRTNKLNPPAPSLFACSLRLTSIPRAFRCGVKKLSFYNSRLQARGEDIHRNEN
jgi:hypothetical protein